VKKPRLWFDSDAVVKGKCTTEVDVYILIVTIGFEGGEGERWWKEVEERCCDFRLERGRLERGRSTLFFYKKKAYVLSDLNCIIFK